MVDDIVYVYPNQSRVHGWDISHWAGGIVDFQKARDVAKASFVFIKATNGINEVRWFRENWKASKGFMPRGAYHWLYPSWVTSANGQARKLYSLLQELGDFGELPVVVDFETTYHNYQPANPSISDLWGFVKTYEDLSGVKPIIYTGNYFWKENGSIAAQWKDYKLWIANYDVDAPKVPFPWTEYTFWQFSERGFGENYGVDKYQKRAVDLNYYVGTIEDFEKEFGFTGTEPPVEPPVDGEPMEYLYEYTSGYTMSLRGGNGVEFVKKSTLAPGQVAKGNTVYIYPAASGYAYSGDSWLHVLEIDGVTCDYWVAIIHQGKTYGQIKTTEEPPVLKDDYPVKGLITWASGAVYTSTTWTKDVYRSNYPD